MSILSQLCDRVVYAAMVLALIILCVAIRISTIAHLIHRS